MLCRLCVTECIDYTEIFEGDGMKYDISNLIATYFTFQVSQDGEHSTIVCSKCLEILLNFYTFCTLVENAQKRWEITSDRDEKGQFTVLVEQSKSCDDNGKVSIKCETEELNSRQSLLLKEEIGDSQPSDIDSPSSQQGEKTKKHRLSKQFDRLIASHTTLICNECNEPMKSFKNLKKHCKEDHKKVGYMICCKRKFFRAADLADHINIHLNPEFFKCLQCDKCFSSRYSLDFHLKSFHINANGKKIIKCEHCPKKFLTQNMLEKHEQTHCETKFNANKYKCTECEKGYPTESKLKAHHFNVHTMTYSRMCHVCGKIVRGNKALERHQLQHAGIKSKVQCEICGTELSTKGILKAHMIALHPEDSNETHVCNECGKNAPSKRALKYHMNYVHKCERSHKCNLCDKSFKRLQALKEHITTHTGDRLYMCPHCPKTFKVRSNMHHHRKLKHPKEFEENRKNRNKGK